MSEMQAEVFHRPVLVSEVLHYLGLGADDDGQRTGEEREGAEGRLSEPGVRRIRPYAGEGGEECVAVRGSEAQVRSRQGTFIDACVGGGGHTRAIVSELMSGRVLGLDVDPDALSEARRQLVTNENVELVQANYAGMTAIVERMRLAPVRGVLFDFGVSYHQLRTAHRGFSFDLEGPLDMRFDQSASLLPALALLRRASQKEVAAWLMGYGQEPYARRLARRISAQRHELRSTWDLAELVRSSVPTRFEHKTLARVFQALRMAVNRELENVRAGLQAALSLLAGGGRLVAISYHSLEDREVKVALREAQKLGRVRILTRKPVRPGEEEVRQNPQSRSARLRAAEVLVEERGLMSDEMGRER